MARRLFRFGAPANSCDGGKRRWLCVDGATKLRRVTRGGRIIQIIARVLLCFLPARPEQPRRSVCGPWAMCLIWASAGFFLLPMSFLGFVGCKRVVLGLGRGLGPMVQ
ncbi:unnamed protein product [Brassica oleracea var. botrytis]